MNTKSQILSIVQQTPQTILQLCAQLNLTRTAINLPIKQLLAEGLIHGTVEPRAGQVGKPSIIYEATQGTEDLHSKAYQPILSALIEQIQADSGEAALTELLQKTGRRMARATLSEATNSFRTNLEAAMKVANSLGATTQLLEQTDGTFILTNRTCPAATAARANGHVCQLMTAFFAQATGGEAAEFCQRDERMVCQYKIIPPKFATITD
jgi:predicted ArsR family transcriptional regulator